MVKKSVVLELVESPENIDSIGGLKNLKEYLRKKSGVIKRIGEAIKAKVAVPKGVFIVGMPGCGKSLCAKATAALFESPLLKLDMGSLMGKYQGESEKNLQIFEVHLRKRDKHGINISDTLVKATDGFNGADIESVVNEAVEDCFVNNQTFTDSVLLDFAKKTVSISKSCKTQIDEMDKIFKESNFKTA